MIRHCTSRRLRPAAAAAVLALALAGCSEVPGLDTVTGLFSSEKDSVSVAESGSGSPDKPIRFQIGDRYTFDNPIERWEIVAIKGERVYWRSDLGERRITGFDPLLPPQEWSGRKRGQGRRLIRDKEGSLYPIKVGATSKYRATVTTDRPPFGWEHQWTCEVVGKETLETFGGSFQTYVVSCGHAEPDRIRYHYAPNIGFYLKSRTKNADGSPDTVRNLLSFERADGSVLAGIVAKPSAGRSEVAKQSVSAGPATRPPSVSKSVPPSPAPPSTDAKPSRSAQTPHSGGGTAVRARPVNPSGTASSETGRSMPWPH